MRENFLSTFNPETDAVFCTFVTLIFSTLIFFVFGHRRAQRREKIENLDLVLDSEHRDAYLVAANLKVIPVQ